MTTMYKNCTVPNGFDAMTATDKTMAFLRAFGYRDNDPVFLRAFGDREGVRIAEKHDCQLYQFPSLRARLSDLNEHQFCGLFFVPNGGGQTDAEVKIARAAFMEMDDGSFNDQLKKIFSFPLEPSIIVKTRKSLHTYWLLRDGKIKRFREIQQQLIAYFGSDEKIINESRTMRLPYSYHNKQEPVLVEIIHFKPENIYTQDQLSELLPEVPDDKTSKGKTAGRNEKFELPDVIDAGDRNHALFCYAASLQAKGFPDQELRAMVHAANADRCQPPLDDREVDGIITSCLNSYPKGNMLKRFHKYTENGKPFDIMDEEIRRYIIAKENIIVTDGQIRIYDGGVYKLDDGDRLLMDKVKQLMFPEVVKINRIRQAVELIRNDVTIQMNLDDVNQYPGSWVNFRNGMLDTRTMELLAHDPKHYAVNQIPHDFQQDYEVPADSVVRRFIDMKFPDAEDRRMFLQFCGYSMTTDTSWQKFLILFGKPDTGKSTLLRLLSDAVGRDNISTLSLQKINERFMSSKLRGMLLNVCADIPTGKMDADDVVKQCVGEDRIHGELKHGAIFSFRSYAKLIFSTNDIPANYADTNGAFNRRLALIQINERGGIIPDLEDGLRKDIQSFIHLCVDALHEATGHGLSESTNSIRHRDELKKACDSVYGFLQDNAIEDPDCRTQRTELYNAYDEYCRENGWQPKAPHNFYEDLVTKGFKQTKVGGDRYINGVRLMDSFQRPEGQHVPFE